MPELPWLVMEAGEALVCRYGICALYMHRTHHTKCRRRLAAEWPAGRCLCSAGSARPQQASSTSSESTEVVRRNCCVRDVALRMSSLLYSLFHLSFTSSIKAYKTDMGGPNRAYGPLQRLQPPTDTVVSGRFSPILVRKQLKSSNSDSISSHLSM